MQPVIFLDFDGVICSPRAYVANAGMTDPLRWADPVACSFVRLLCEKASARIVVSSTWRLSPARAHAVLGAHNLAGYLHDDWCTNTSPDGQRQSEIDDWLHRNGCPPFVILDDDSFAWTPEQRMCWVHTDCVEGMALQHYERAVLLLTGNAPTIIM